MTSIRDLLSEALAVGDRFCLEVSETDESGTPIAAHPNAGSPMDIAICEGLERLGSVPPETPLTVEVEIVGRIVDGRIAGRVVGLECEEPENR